MTTEGKYCVDCKYYKRLRQLFGVIEECHHENNLKRDLVSGKQGIQRYIHECRKYECKGEWFERKGEK